MTGTKNLFSILVGGDLETSLTLSQSERVRVSGSARTLANGGDDLVATSDERLILRRLGLELELVSVETRSQVEDHTTITWMRN